MSNDPSARITLIEAPIASPGQCGMCGKNSHPKGFAAADNFDFEFFGTLIFCEDCVGEYARLFDYASPSEVNSLRNRILQLNLQIEALKHENSVLEGALDGFTGLNNLRSRHAIYDSSSSDGAVGEPSDANEDVEGVVSGGTANQLTFDELANEQGPDDVRDAASASAGIDELLAL